MIRETLRLNRRIRFIATLSALLGIGLGLFGLLRVAPYGIAKIIVEHEMSKIFKQEVTIEKMSGNIISVATFKGIRFKNHPQFGAPGTVLEIGEATAHYSLLQTFRHKGDFAAGTHTLRLKRMVINAHRSKKDLWNVLMILPPPPPGAPPQPLTFTGRLYIEDSEIQIRDDLGWGQTPHSHPFKETLHDLSGVADFDNISNARIAWSGNLGDTQAPTLIIGNLNTLNGQWNFRIRSSSLPLKKWGPYVMPQKELSLYAGYADIDAQIRSKYFPNKGEFPLWYDVTAQLRDAQFRMAAFPIPATEIEGSARIHNNQFTEAHALRVVNGHPNKAKALIKTLRDTEIIDADDHVQITATHPDKLKDRLPTRWHQHLPTLYPLIHEPATSIDLNIRSGQIGQSPFSAAGVIGLNHNAMALKLYSATFQVASIQKLFPTLTRWKINGTGVTSLSVTGPPSSPTIVGSYTIPKGYAFGFPVQNLSLAIHYTQRQLSIRSLSGMVHDGGISVIASANFQTPVTAINATILSTNLNTHRIGTGIVTGRLSTEIALQGPSHRLKMTIKATSTEGIRWMNQELHLAKIKGTILNGSDVVVDASAWINGSTNPALVFGLIQNWSTVTFAFELSDIFLRDIQPGQNGVGIATMKGQIGAELTPPFWESPRNTMTITANGHISHPVLYGQTFDHAKIDFTLTPTHFTLRELDAHIATASVVMNGQFLGRSPKRLYIKTHQFPIGHASIIQTLIPHEMKPFSGIFTGSGVITARNQDATRPITIVDLIASGNLKIDRATIRGQAFDTIMMVGEWNGRQMMISHSLFQKEKSILSVSGSLDADRNINLTINQGTTLFLQDFPTIIHPLIGSVTGGGPIFGTVSGNISNPNVQLSLNFSKMEFGGVQVRAIRGEVGLNDGKITASQLFILPKEGQVEISGYFNLSPLFSKEDIPFDYDLQVNVTPISLGVVAELIESIRREWLSRFGTDKSIPLPEIRNANVTVRGPNPFIQVDPSFSKPTALLYTITNEPHSLDTLKQVKTLSTYSQYVSDIGLSSYLSGTFSGYLRAKSNQDLPPKLDAKLEFSDATLSFLRGRRITLGINSIESRLVYQFAVEKGDLGGSPFESFVSEGSYTPDGYLTISKSEVLVSAGHSHSILNGRFPLSAFWNSDHINNPMNISLTWAGDDINILSIVIPHLKQVKNKGSVVLRVEGPIIHPVISTEKVNLIEASILLNEQMSPLISPLKIKQGTFSIDKNIVSISGLRFEWAGVDTMRLGSDTPETNRMTLNGTISFDVLHLSKPDVAVLGMDLNFGESSISINFPKIYRGRLNLKKLKINGQYTIPISKTAKETQVNLSGTERETGPVISGEVTLFEGELSMPTIGERPLRPNFQLNVSGRINQNVRLVGSLVGEGILADVANRFDLALAETISPVIISGTLNAPKIQNAVVVSTGYINLINRQFEILSIDRQREYFRNNQYKIHNNSVEFQTDYSSPKNRLIPQLNITALAIIEPLSTTSNIQAESDSTKYSHVLVNVVGSAYSLQGFQFEKYVSQRADTIDRLEFRGTYRLGNGPNDGTGDSSDIARLLAPELLETDPNDPNAGNGRIMTQLGSGAINYISQTALRGVEQGLAKNIGVDDIQINYNLGDAVFRNTSSQTVGVSVGKSLFSNQLFIRARTDVDIEKRKYANTLQISDIELTYYLERYLSLNYSNFIDDAGDSRNRYNIKYSYDF